MVSKTLLFLVIVSFVSDSYEQRDRQFFRKDYTYMPALESFYKIHTISLTWPDAKLMCALEGGILWHPENEDEANVLLSYWNSTYPKIKWMYVGMSDILVEGVFVTVDDKSISDVYSTWEEGEPNNANGYENCVHIDQKGYMNDCECEKKFTFICKKTLESLEWNNKCNIPNLGYAYNKDTGKCYKLHTTPLTWPEASARCEVEQTSLAEVNNHREAYYLVQLTEAAPKPRILENYQRGIYHLGFHNRFKEGWQTLSGSPLKVDNDIWFENNRPEGLDQCGSMFYTGRLINTECNNMKSFFICQHQPSEPSEVFSPISVTSTYSVKPPIQPFFGFGAE